MTGSKTEITSGKIYGYARVSTVQQDLALQMEALIKAGVPNDSIYYEKMSKAVNPYGDGLACGRIVDYLK